MIHRMTETEPQGFRQHNLSSTRTNVRFLSSLGRLVLSSMLDAKEQGAQRPRKAPSYLSFYHSESRYRSSDVGRAHLPLLRKVVWQARHLCAQSAALMCDGDTHTPLYARRTVRITGTSGWVPITAQSSTDATDHDALQPLRGSEADCVRSPIRQSIPSRPQHRSKRRGTPAPKRWGGAPFSINEGRPQRASPASLKDKRGKNTIKPAWLSHSLNSHRTIYAGYRINCTVTPHNVAVGFMR